MTSADKIFEQEVCDVNTVQTEFTSEKNPKAKITLEFSTEERNAQRDFVNILKNLYIAKLKNDKK